jgi:hypothetical protein
VIDLMPKEYGSSFKTVVIISSQRDKLGFWPRPYEVKRVAKMGENTGKSGKLDILLNFRKVWDTIKLKTRAFYKATLHTQLTKNSEFFGTHVGSVADLHEVLVLE